MNQSGILTILAKALNDDSSTSWDITDSKVLKTWVQAIAMVFFRGTNDKDGSYMVWII